MCDQKLAYALRMRAPTLFGCMPWNVCCLVLNCVYVSIHIKNVWLYLLLGDELDGLVADHGGRRRCHGLTRPSTGTGRGGVGQGTDVVLL